MNLTFDLINFVLGFGTGAVVSVALHVSINKIRNNAPNNVTQRNIHAKTVSGRDTNKK